MSPLAFETPLHLLAWLDATFTSGAWLSRPGDRGWGYFLCQPMVTGWTNRTSFTLQADCVGVEKAFFFPVTAMIEMPPPLLLFSGRTFRLDCIDHGETYLLDTEVPSEVADLAHQAKVECEWFYTLDVSLTAP